MENKEYVTKKSSLNKKTVFLFKSPKDNEVDKFTESLEEVGLSCVTIPVLSFRFINQSVLQNHLSAIHLFSAIVFTSVRAVEAVVNLTKDLENERNIFHMQSFVIGNTTAEIAKKSGFSPKGENCGNAKALAEFILSEGLQVTEVVSYETCPNKNMKEAIQTALDIQGFPDYAVFFSPSGIKYTQAVVEDDLLQLDKVKIIALGPSTYKSLCDSGLTPFGMAEKPEPQSLIQLLS